MDYKGLLDRVIDQYYSKNYEPDLKGYIKWREPTQREKDKSLKAELEDIANAVKSRAKDLRSKPNWAKN